MCTAASTLRFAPSVTTHKNATNAACTRMSVHPIRTALSAHISISRRVFAMQLSTGKAAPKSSMLTVTRALAEDEVPIFTRLRRRFDLFLKGTRNMAQETLTSFSSHRECLCSELRQCVLAPRTRFETSSLRCFRNRDFLPGCLHNPFLCQRNRPERTTARQFALEGTYISVQGKT